MFPHGDLLIDRVTGGYGTDLSIVIAVLACGTAGNVHRSLAVVARIGTIAVEEPEERSLDAILLRNDVAHTGAGDEFLALEHAAQQEPDNHEHDRNFNQGKAFLVTHNCGP